MMEELLEQQLAETKLPAELQDWFDQFVGGADVSLEFDSAIYCEDMNSFRGTEF